MKLSRPNMVALLATLIVIIGLLSAYAIHQHLLLSAGDIARQVAAHYGDSHPQDIQVQSTQTDNPPHDPMYLITITGNFHKGTLKAHSLSFSALATKMYAWNIYAFDQSGKQQWMDNDLTMQ